MSCDALETIRELTETSARTQGALRMALAASEEVVALYTAQLLPCEHAVKASLHALGVPPDAIDKAVKELCKKEEKAIKENDAALKQQKEEQKLNAEERKVGMEATKAQIEVTKKEAAGMIKKPAAGSSK